MQWLRHLIKHGEFFVISKQVKKVAHPGVDLFFMGNFTSQNDIAYASKHVIDGIRIFRAYLIKRQAVGDKSRKLFSRAHTSGKQVRTKIIEI